MPIHDAQNLAQYPQNPAGSGPMVSFVDIVDDPGRAETLLAELRSAGVVLRIEGDRLAFDAPADVITDDLLARMRADRDGLMVLVGDQDPGGDRGAGDDQDPGDVQDGGGPVVPTSIRCPWCESIDLADHPGGLRCGRCGRWAWLVDEAGGIERADLAETDLVDPASVPACSSCGRSCDVVDGIGGWACSGCEPSRERVTMRLMAIKRRWARSA